MGKFGAAANIAAELVASGCRPDPRSAWDDAVALLFEDSLSSQEKGCPRDTFLSLCGAGVIKGIPAGEYTRSEKNRDYALRGLSALRSDPSLVRNERGLWRIACPDPDKTYNSQMDVLAQLWHRRWIE